MYCHTLSLHYDIPILWIRESTAAPRYPPQAPLAGAGQAGREQEKLAVQVRPGRSEAHKSELQSLMRISYVVFCLKKKKTPKQHSKTTPNYFDDAVHEHLTT